MYLYGAGGHAKVVVDILKSQRILVDSFIDDNSALSEFMGYVVLHDATGMSPVIISIGDNKVRKSIADRLQCEYGIAVHTSAIISSVSIISCGSVVMPGAIIQSDVHIGHHCIINTAATVDHECMIDDFVHISPNATLCGNVQIGQGSQIGAGSIIVPGVKVGKWSLVCAGSVVTRDIPDYCIAAGNRCKVIKYIR